MIEPHDEPTPEQRAALASVTNAELLDYYRAKIPRISAAIKDTQHTIPKPDELAQLAKGLRLHHAKLSQWNIAAGEHAHPDLIAAEEYLEGAARDLEASSVSPPPDEDDGEAWKRAE